jgi:hypothetical protein
VAALWPFMIVHGKVRKLQVALYCIPTSAQIIWYEPKGKEMYIIKEKDSFSNRIDIVCMVIPKIWRIQTWGSSPLVIRNIVDIEYPSSIYGFCLPLWYLQTFLKIFFLYYIHFFTFNDHSWYHIYIISEYEYIIEKKICTSRVKNISALTYFPLYLFLLPNSEQSYKGKVKTHNYINRQNQSTTGKLWKS